MDIYRSMTLFVEVAKEGSIAAAGRKLHLSPPSATRLLNELEQWLGQPLVRRTTRHVSLTELGESYLPACMEILEKTQALKANAREKAVAVSGKLSITTSDILARRVLTPVISRFLTAYPDVSFDINTSHKVVDFMSDNIDIAFRTGTLQDSSLIARRVFNMHMKLVASPGFIASYGLPESDKQLLSLPCLISSMPVYGAKWPFLRGKSVSGPVRVDNGDITCALAVKGHGIAYLPELFVEQEIADGRLLEILPDRERDTLPVYALFPPRDYISVAARKFVQYVEEYMACQDACKESENAAPHNG